MLTALSACLILFTGCDSKPETIDKGRQAVKDVVTQPFNTLDSAKDSIKQSENKQKDALEELDKQSK
jgi:hypothetical protein